MSETIDTIDRAILRILQRDSTVGVDALAEQVHLSRNACWRRVKQLEARKIIRDRVVLLDPDSVDLGLSVRFYQELIRRIDISDVSASFVMEDIKDTTVLPL